MGSTPPELLQGVRQLALLIIDLVGANGLAKERVIGREALGYQYFAALVEDGMSGQCPWEVRVQRPPAWRSGLWRPAQSSEDLLLRRSAVGHCVLQAFLGAILAPLDVTNCQVPLLNCCRWQALDGLRLAEFSSAHGEAQR